LAVAVSGLITHVIPLVRLVKGELSARGLESVSVVAGGAALKQSTPEKLNVDFVGETAFDGLHFIEGLAGLTR
jgi:methanogenic corrinoid protein MtbC1